MMRLYSERGSILIESSNSFNNFVKIKKEISSFNKENSSDSGINNIESASEINILKEDLEWFNSNEEKIMSSFREKFHESIKNRVSRKNYKIYIKNLL